MSLPTHFPLCTLLSKCTLFFPTFTLFFIYVLSTANFILPYDMHLFAEHTESFERHVVWYVFCSLELRGAGFVSKNQNMPMVSSSNLAFWKQ